MPQIIDERHSAFIKGRQLLHGFLVANEVVEEVYCIYLLHKLQAAQLLQVATWKGKGL